jgi:hypothetical protein
MLGKAAVAMWWDIAAEVKVEWEDWHSREHMPERLGIPGFLRGSRWVAPPEAPSAAFSYFVLYEAAKLATVTTGAYAERLNNPTPWSRKMMPHHRNMVRSLCRVRASVGGGLADTLATIRFSPAPGRKSVAKWLADDALPALLERKGLTGVHLLESQPMPSAQTAEQKIRGMDAVADRVLLICGYDAEAVRMAANELASDTLAAHGALPGAVYSLYHAAFCLTPKDLA